MPRYFAVLAVVLLTFNAPTWTLEPGPSALTVVEDDDPAPVGDWARPTQWLITGHQVVPEARLRAALLDHPPILAATHARAPRGVLVRELREGLLSAYQAYGHVATSVRVGSRADRLAIAIDEGERCIAGPVEVVGMSLAPPAEFIAALADAQDEHLFLKDKGVPQMFTPQLAPKRRERAALWTVGGIPDANAENLRRIEYAAAAFYERRGRMAVRCSASVQQDGNQVRLRIVIVDEGRPAVLARLTWQDLRPELIPQVEADFGLRQGMPCSQASIMACLDRMYASGRLFPPRVQVAETPGGYALTIATRELTSLPPYPEPLSPEAEVLLRTHRWVIDNFVNGPEEVFFHFSEDDGSFELALSRSAAAIRWTYGGKERLRAWSDGDRWIIADPANGRCFATSGLWPFIGLSLSSRPPSTLDGDEHDLSLQYGCRSGKRPGDLVHVEQCAPSAFVAQAYRRDDRHQVVRKDLELRDGTLIFGKSKGFFSDIVLDVTTGRPLPSPKFAFTKGAVARLRAEFEQTSAGLTAPQTLDAASSVVVLLDLMLDLAVGQQKTEAQAVALAHARLLVRHVIAPASRWFLSTLVNGDTVEPSAFTIPPSSSDAFIPRKAIAALTDRVLAPPALALQERLPVASWPPVILRGAQAALAGRMPLVNQDLEATVRRPDFGPVGALVIAAILDRFSPREAAQFAALGLQLVADEARFRAELALLKPFASGITAWAAEPGTAALLDLFAERRPAVEAALSSALAEARRSGADPAATVEAAALAMWRAGMRDWVGDRLFDVAAGRMPGFTLPWL